MRANIRYSRMFSVFLVLWVLASSPPAPAQDVAGYPSKPMRLIIPFPPGGAADLIGRSVAVELSKSWGQGVVTHNEAGASGTVGLSLGMKAAPDGHTMILVSVSTLINQYVQSVPYDLLRDFAPLTQIAAQPFILVVNAAVPAKNLKELIAFAKANPGKLNYASSGAGGAGHLAGALFAQMGGVQMTHVPYKGGGPAMIDVVAGVAQLIFSTQVQAAPQLKSGKLRVLGVTAPRRESSMPDVPTMAEAGVPGYEVVTWQAIMLPARTPQAIIAKLNQEVTRIVRTPEVTARLVADGSEPVAGTPEELTAMLRADSAKWARLVKDVGLKAQ